MCLVYLLRSKQRPSLSYVGYTTRSVHERLKEHNGFARNKYSNRGRPWELVCTVKFTSRHEAICFERKVKYQKNKSGLYKSRETRKCYLGVIGRIKKIKALCKEEGIEDNLSLFETT
uniref:GIY-YIG domain-containing protein n=1 Tax=Aplanochytrium stocchinoi TaxID=215587 RepID=A0A7S3PMS1_9STRA|mmetsp:Transcript_18672/g.22803  ORF Transcript_18672/g.22803 Transcript_18672/m.22803 type:complete len:117 (+) Transcript_18672:470-820(+)